MIKKFKYRKTGEIATYEDGILKSSGFCVEIGVEPSSEFWEEVIEKDFEILSWYFGDMNITTNPDGSAREYFIHSIKRLSDGEVFTIGDKINFNDAGVGKLLQIQFEVAPADKGTGKLCFVNDHKTLGKWWNISQLSKVKPLFITEDGYEIFLGDSYYYIDENIIYENKRAISKSGSGGFKYFKEKTNAEWYIFENKPVLSLKDVQSIYVSAKPGYKKNGVEQEYYDKLCNLIKSKL